MPGLGAWDVPSLSKCSLWAAPSYNQLAFPILQRPAYVLSQHLHPKLPQLLEISNSFIICTQNGTSLELVHRPFSRHCSSLVAREDFVS